MERKTIRQPIESIDISEDSGTLYDFYISIKDILDFILKNEMAGAEFLGFDVERDCEGNLDGLEVVAFKQFLEPEEQARAREAFKEERRQEVFKNFRDRVEISERAQYERLRKKFDERSKDEIEGEIK